MTTWPTVLWLGVLASTMLMIRPGTSDAQFVPYDDFRGNAIDPAKWFGSELTGGAANPTTELSRLVRGEALTMQLTQYGNTSSNSGTSSGEVRLRVTDPAGITGMQANVTVLQADAEPCPANPATVVRGRAMVAGMLFNNGESTGPTDRTGDVFAAVQLIRDTLLGDVIQPLLNRCTNSACTANAALSTTPPLSTFATRWTPGTPIKVIFVWDQAPKMLTYRVKSPASPREVQHAVYTASDAAAPVLDFKQLLSSNSAVNCTSGQMRTLMKASFDGVNVNIQ